MEPGKWVKVEGIEGVEKARELIVEAIARAGDAT
jgi:inorganic pyrophosphatase